jgi:hypothetical protein
MQIYNYAGNSRIDSVLMQPAELWQNRIAAPVPLEKIADDYIRNQLIAKFAAAYLEVAPSTAELESRAASRGALRMMAAPAALSAWESEVMPELRKMANEKKFRKITVRARDIEQRGDYFVVPIATKTWNAPNDINALPVVERGKELYLKLRFNKKIRETLQGRDFNAGAFMDRGGPPAAIFEFMVDEAVIK